MTQPIASDAESAVAVIAHTLRTSVAVVETALRTLEDTAMDLTDLQRGEVLSAALRHTVHVGAVLESLVRALPTESLDAPHG